MASVMKHVTDFGYNMVNLTFWRNLGAMLILLPLVFMRRKTINISIKNKKLFFARSLLGFISMLLMFYSVSLLAVSDWIALTLTIPIFTSVGAVIFLGEKMGWHRWGAVLLGFSGAMVIVGPGFEQVNYGYYICIATCMTIAGVLLIVKKLSATEDSFSMMYNMHLWMLGLNLLIIPFFWETPTWDLIIWSTAIGILSISAHYCMIKSYTLTDISLTAPLDFSRVVMASIIAYLFLDEIISTESIIGAIIITASASYIAHREVRRKKAR